MSPLTSSFLGAPGAAVAVGAHDPTSGGTDFFTNAEPASVPETLSGEVAGVVGLDDTSSPHPLLVHPSSTPKTAPHYGAGPYRSGLVPSQTRSLHGATKLFNTGVDGQGHGVVSAVFELSGYANSDDEHWLHGRHLQQRPRLQR
jgi:hypothetical protein